MSGLIVGEAGLYFKELDSRGKTERWAVLCAGIPWVLVSNSKAQQNTGQVLGYVHWHGLSKQYAFYASGNAVLTQPGLARIFRFVKFKNNEYEETARQERLRKLRLQDPRTDRIFPPKEGNHE